MEAKLAHGGFLLQPTRINQAERAVESEQPMRPVVFHPSLLFALSSVSFKWGLAQKVSLFLRLCTTDPISSLDFTLFLSLVPCYLLCDLKQKNRESMLLIFVFMCSPHGKSRLFQTLLLLGLSDFISPNLMLSIFQVKALILIKLIWKYLMLHTSNVRECKSR